MLKRWCQWSPPDSLMGYYYARITHVSFHTQRTAIAVSPLSQWRTRTGMPIFDVSECSPLALSVVFGCLQFAVIICNFMACALRPPCAFIKLRSVTIGRCTASRLRCPMNMNKQTAAIRLEQTNGADPGSSTDRMIIPNTQIITRTIVHTMVREKKE